jgi:hypothetical protein
LLQKQILGGRYWIRMEFYVSQFKVTLSAVLDRGL